jgi:hypothetical protein
MDQVSDPAVKEALLEKFVDQQVIFISAEKKQ